MALSTGLKGAIENIERGVGFGTSGLSRFQDAGLQAQQQQSALAGLQGQQAFNQALMNNPAIQFQREQGERAVLRNAAALGGLGGGNVMKELSRFGTGLAAQDLQNQFNRASQIAGQGLGAAGQLGDIGLRAGQFAGQAALDVGRDIAQNVSGTTSALAQLRQQQGAGLSDIIGQSGGNLANLLSGAGQAQAGSQQNLAALLANLATQQGSTVAGLRGIPGVQQQQGNLGGLGQLASGLGAGYQAYKLAGLKPALAGAAAIGTSDIRLKENIRQIGVSEGGHNLYQWDWNDKAKALGVDSPAIGVIAQEVKEKNPEAVITGDHGYLMVNYAGLN